MNARKVLGFAVVVPALVVGLAQPSSAASRDVVTFAGTFELKPTTLPQQQVTDLCFFAPGASCANGVESSGVAAGAGAVLSEVAPRVVDGMQARATYVEACSPGTAFQPIGSAQLTGRVHDRLTGDWSGDVSATWVRAGLVAVIQGDAVGAALFTPAGVPACDVASSYAVAGVVEIAD